MSSVIDDINSNGVLSQLPEYKTAAFGLGISPIPPIPPGPIPCFIKGTKILTDKGYKLIEKLKYGDNLINNKGDKIKLLDIYTFNKYKSIENHPCLIKKGTIINDFKCNDDLYLSQNHSILINNYFVPVHKLFKPIKIKDDKDYYSYYHIITENFFTDVIISNGILTETYSKKIEKTLGKNLFNNLLNHITKNNCRPLLEKHVFNNLILKISNTGNMKKMIL